jgi:diacylglycerol kinase (ATP)
MKRYKIIANPEAGRGRSASVVRRTVAAFKRRGADFDLEMTRAPGHAAEIARRSLDDYDVIVTAGGDGTVNEVLPGIVLSGKPLAIVPGGSGNDFIKVLHIPSSVEKAVSVIFEGAMRTIDVGRINGHYFANAVGIGFDAAVNRESYGINHRKQGFGLYLRALLRMLGRFEPVRVRIQLNGESFDERIFLLTLGNGTTVGGGFRLTPHAVIDDGLLDVTLVRPLSVPRLLWHLPKVFLGTVEKVRTHVSLWRTQKLIIESDDPVPIHVDGEMFDDRVGHFEIEVVPQALTVIGNWGK